MFVQVLEPLGSVWVAAGVALLPLGVLLVCLAGLRISAWAAVLLCAAVTIALAVVVWDAPIDKTLMAYGLGSATGLWSVGWIVFWGLVIYNTMVTMGAFAALRDWLVMAAGPDVRVQVLVLAWAFGALLEGLVGFGYPWAVVAPILIGLGMSDLAALRTAALGNTAPGVQRCARRAHHRAGRSHRIASARALRVDRESRGGPGDRAAVPPHLPGVGP